MVDVLFRSGGVDTVLGRLSVKRSGEVAGPRFRAHQLRDGRRGYLRGV